ncbi:MAG: hypothetical protein ACP5HM_05800 [Anaerolineae bacterium]
MTGDLLLPALILVLLIIIGLTILVVVMLLGKNRAGDPGEGPSHRRTRPSSDSILSVHRNPQGLLEVCVRGTPYPRLSDVPDTATREEVVDAIKIVAAFGRDYIVRREKKRPQRTPTVTSTEKQPAISVPSEEPHLRRPSKLPTLMPQINLAKEIGEIVEGKQRQRPSLAARSIRLQNAPGGGIRFVIDGHTYTSVEEIPDLEIQALIREATREWEQQ